MINILDPVVERPMNELLCAPFKVEEIYRALFDMHPSKALGPDGFTGFFYQKIWPIIGADIISAALSILNEQRILPIGIQLW